MYYLSMAYHVDLPSVLFENPDTEVISSVSILFRILYHKETKKVAVT